MAKPTDAALIEAVKATNGVFWAIQAHLAAFPKKVVWRALQSAVQRKVLNGCACGCRGDFTIGER